MEKYYLFRNEEIQAGRLVSNQGYQRPISPKELKEIIDNFDWNLVNPIKVSLRNGSYYVWDGQHTLTSIISLYGNTTIVPVQVYEGLTYEKEAELVAKQDEFKRKMSKTDQNNAYLESKEKTRVDFAKVCKEVGFMAMFDSCHTKKVGYVQNTTFVYEKVYMKYGEEMLKDFLMVFKLAFNSEPDAQRSHTQMGLLRFMTLYKGEYDFRRLVDVLTGLSPSIIKKNANNDRTHTKADAVCLLFVELYNKGKRSNRLPNKIDKEG